MNQSQYILSNQVRLTHYSLLITSERGFEAIALLRSEQKYFDLETCAEPWNFLLSRQSFGQQLRGWPLFFWREGVENIERLFAGPKKTK